MITVSVYFLEKNSELDALLANLQELQPIVPHQIAMIDLNSDRTLKEKIGPNLPVIEIGPYHLRPPFTRQDLQIILTSARDRVGQLQKIDHEGYQQRLDRGRTVTGSDKVTIWLSRHYLALVNILLIIYAGLPFLAPVLMNNQQTFLANMIYRGYSIMCHQLAFRSWFLFGAQPYYPRDLAGLSNIMTYEILNNSSTVDLMAARSFTGNELVGYKVALCQRDVAIYGFMLLFGLVYAVSGRRFRSIPWFYWVVIGLVPIAVDGFSQLLAFIPALSSLIPARESTPLLRTVTGALFGWMTAWYLFPMLEATARETRLMMQRKMAVIEQTGPQNQEK